MRGNMRGGAALLDVSVGVVTILFTLSLLGAWILFKVLKSKAIITKPEYQVGGAAAGFLLIYAALYQSYTGLANIDGVRAQLTGCKTSLAAEADFVSVRGTIEPKLRYANAFVATNESQVDVQGKFTLRVRAKDLKTGHSPALWIVNDQQKYFLNLDEQDLTQSLVFKIPVEDRP
ncbi:MAG: hypothetical protein JWO80_3502 [Bryobacterales bacterium]|nr:hypothetical protein [Bryobacterales bacterium]